MNSLECKILSSEPEMVAIADGWRQLHAKAGGNIFTQYDWVDAWWNNIGMQNGWGLRIVTGWRDGKLAAVLPLAIEQSRGLRTLQWAGAEWFDYCDALAENTMDVALLWQVVKQSGGYDFAIIRDVHQDGLSGTALAAFARVREKKEASYLDIVWPSSDAWLQSMPKKKRGVLRRRTNQMTEQKGPVEFKVCTEGPIDNALLDTLMRQKTVWLAAGKHKLIFDQPGGKAMFRQLVKSAAEQGILLLGWLTVNGEVVACHVCFVQKNILYSYQSSFEQSWSNYSPGTVLLLNMICYAADHGIKRFDHMRGAYAYKDKYSSGVAPLCDYSFAGSFLGKLAECAKSVRAKLVKKNMTARAPAPESDQD